MKRNNKGGLRVARNKIQQGFTLIEVMVAVLVLAIGLLGAAMLQVITLKNNQAAEYRTEATAAAYDIIDRMRVNRIIALTGGYTVGLGAPATAGATPESQDIFNWKTALAANLPVGDGSITMVNAGAGVVQVSVQWNDERAGGAAIEIFAVEVRL